MLLMREAQGPCMPQKQQVPGTRASFGPVQSGMASRKPELCLDLETAECCLLVC